MNELQAGTSNEFIQGLLGQMDQQRQQKQALLMQMIQSGQYQPAQQQQPTTFMQRFGNNAMGPNMGSPSPMMAGQQFQQVTPQMRQAQMQAQMQQYGSLLGNSGAPGQATQQPQMEREVTIDPSTGQAKITLKAKPSETSGDISNLGNLSPDQAKEQLQKTNPVYAKYLEKLAHGDINLAGRGSKFIQKVQQDMTYLYPGVDMKDINAKFNMRKDFTVGKAAQNIKSLNTAVQHLSELNKVIPELHDTGVKPLNQILQTMGRTFGPGSDVLAKFRAIKVALAGELSAIYKNSGGTDQEIQHVSDTIDSADSPEALKASVKEAVVLMSGRLSALKDQWKSAYNLPGDPDEPPRGIISPRSRSTLRSMGLGQEADVTDQVGEQQQNSIGNKNFSSLWN